MQKYSLTFLFLDENTRISDQNTLLFVQCLYFCTSRNIITAMSLANRVKSELRGDSVIWMIVAVLALCSILAVYSSSGTLAFKERGGHTEVFLIKQIVMLVIGLVLTYLCHLMHYQRYSKAAPVLLIIAVVLLALTLLIGPNINGSRRWLQIPIIGMTFQTSDFAKIAVICFVARSISTKQEVIKDFSAAFVPIIVPIIVVCMLIAPSDLSTALIIFTTCFMMMFIGRVDTKYLFLLVFCAIVGFAFLIMLGKAYPEHVRVSTWISRALDYFTNADGGFQTQQAKIAISKGGFIGQGPGNSTQRNYLPSPYTDYIYSIIIEEYGLLGGFIINALFVLLLMRVVRLVTIGNKTFGAMLAVGFGLILCIQALANMAVSVHLVPVAGLPMPMVSMGGTSLLFSCISLGIILSVSKHIEAAREA